MILFDKFSPEEKQDYLSLTTPEAKRIFAQEFFKRDFGAFVYLLGYRDLGEFHQEQLLNISKFRYLEDSVRRLWFWARGFFKTSLITEAHTLWLIVNNPNIRILIVSYSLEVAKKPLGALRNQLIGNQDFRYFFKEFCPVPNKEGKIEFGTTENFTVPNRTKQLKEPTIMCAGIGTNITGLHFDVMKIDDLVNKDSVTNETQIQSSKDYYSLLRPIFDNPVIPREDVIGTIYHFNDLHSDLMKNPAFEKSFIPAQIDGKFVFHERLDEQGWNDLNNDPTQSPYSIQSQWMLRPVNPKDAKFKDEWFHTYQSLPASMAEYILVDPASTQKKKSDYTVIERWGISNEGKHYLISGYRDKLTSFQRIDLLFKVVSESKNLKWVSYEVLGGRHGDLEVIKKKQQDDQKFFYVKETKATSSSKEDRIEQRLVPPFNAGVILFPQSFIYQSLYDGKTHDFIQEYRLEFLQFPFTEHDDILDCHSQMFEEPAMLMKGEKIREVTPSKGMTADDWEAIYDNIDREQRAFPYLDKNEIYNRLRVKRFKKMVAG